MRGNTISTGDGGGYCDGYYAIGALNPSPGGTGSSSSSTYNIKNQAIIGIRPSTTTGDTSIITVTSNNSSHGTVSGSGEYSTLNDTVIMRATALEGCRFLRWDDGCTYNPRAIIADGDMRRVAIFEQLHGDTLGYTNNHYYTSCIFDYFGIRLPSSVLSASKRLRGVQLYDSDGGTYTLNVYQGDTINANSPIYTHTYILGGIGEMTTLSVLQAVPIDNTQDLWITFYCDNVNNPAPVSPNSNNADGAWYSNDGVTWEQFSTYNYNYTMMATAIFDDIDACSNTTFPIIQDFTNGMECWEAYSMNNSNDDKFGIREKSGNNVFVFSSYNRSSNYKQYLVSPRIETEVPLSLSFAYKAYRTDAENFKVLYSTTGFAPSDFTHTLSTTTTNDDQWHTITLFVPAEARYIAFNYYSDYAYYVYIDSIIIDEAVTHSIDFACDGLGSGSIVLRGSSNNLCGGRDLAGHGFSATYKITPATNSTLAHLYIDGTDYINNAPSTSDVTINTTSTNTTLTFADIQSDMSVNAVFDTLPSHTVTIINQGTGYLFYYPHENGDGTFVSDTLTTIVPNTNDASITMARFSPDGPYAQYADYYGCLRHLYVNGDEISLDNNPAVTILDYWESNGYLLFNYSLNGLTQDCAIVVQYGDCNQQVDIPSTSTPCEPSFTVSSTPSMCITVSGVTGQRINIFDCLGRLLATAYAVSTEKTFRMTSPGVYFVQVGDTPARKVVEVR